MFKLDKITIFLLYLYAAFSFNQGMQQMMLYTVLPGSLCLSLFCIKDKHLSKNMKFLLGMYLWAAFTTPFAYKIDRAIQELTRMSAAVILSYTIYLLAKKRDNIKWLYGIWIVLYASMWQYARNKILNQIDFEFGVTRMNDENLNANLFGYLSFFVTSGTFFISEIVNNKIVKKVFNLLFLAFIPLSFYLAILTASRQILIIQAPLIIYLLYIRYLKNNRGIIPKIMLLAIVGVSIYFLMTKGVDIYENSLLAKRSEENIEEDVRSFLIKDALYVGATNPLFGVGGGCFGLYKYGRGVFSHNTYTELFANFGIIAILMYLKLLYEFLKTQWNCYKNFKDTQYLLFFFFGVIFVFDNMFYVFYINAWLISFFVLVMSHAKLYRQNTINSYDYDN